MARWALSENSRIVSQRRVMMYRSDWLDDMHWGAVALGVTTALAMQVAITLLVLNPLAITLSWTAVVLVELCIASRSVRQRMAGSPRRIGKWVDGRVV
jgi:hypothetical protein